MNFTINAFYKQAIEDFSWETSDSPLSVSSSDFNRLISKLSQEIIAAHTLGLKLEKQGEKPSSLIERSYCIIESLDLIKSNSTILNLILHASPEEKKLLKQTLNPLAKRLKEMKEMKKMENQDLKTLTLLFGIKLVHDLAIQYSVQWSKITQLQVRLNSLQSVKKAHESEGNKSYLQDIDFEIQESQQHLDSALQNL